MLSACDPRISIERSSLRVNVQVKTDKSLRMHALAR